MSKPRLLDLFSGAGGFSLGFEAAGFETVAFSEIEPFPCKILAYRWPDVPNLGDVCQIDGEEVGERFGPIDVVSFGSPCQDWSVAGKRLGLEGERSSLFHEAIRIIRGVRPEFAIFENVPGLFSSAGGWDFAAVLDELAESGAMDIAWSVLDAQWFGVPQRRRRVFVVADFRGERAGEILSISEGVCRGTPPSRETREESTGGSGDGLEESVYGVDGELNAAKELSGPLNITSQSGGGHPARVAFVPEISHALTAHQSGQRNDPSEQTFLPVSFGWQNSPEQGEEVIEDGCAPVRASTTPAVAYGVSNDPSPKWIEETMPPLQAKEDGGGRMDAVAFAENQRGEVRTSDTHPQLTAGGGKPGQGYPAVAVAENGVEAGAVLSDTVNALTSGGGKARQGFAATLQGMAVRRLTPLECERLMGWPDGHTAIPYGKPKRVRVSKAGEPERFEMRRVPAPDSGRYRACGNGVAAPVVEWVARRIKETA